jgi:hypothetical protein
MALGPTAQWSTGDTIATTRAFATENGANTTGRQSVPGSNCRRDCQMIVFIVEENTMATITWIEAIGDHWTEATDWHADVTFRAIAEPPVSVNGVAFVGPRGGALPHEMLVAGGGTESASGATAGGPEPDLILAGAESDGLATGSAANIFLFSNGAAMDADATWDFTRGGDEVALPGYGGEQVQSSLALDSTSIVLADNTRVTFGGLAAVSAADYR